MARPPLDFDYKILPGDDDNGPKVKMYGTGFDGPYEEIIEFWPDPPTVALKPMEMFEIGGERVPRVDVLGAIEALIATRRWVEQEVTVENGDGTSHTESKGEWEHTDDIARFRSLVDSTDIAFIPIQKLGLMYQDIQTAVIERPTSQSRRT